MCIVMTAYEEDTQCAETENHEYIVKFQGTVLELVIICKKWIRITPKLSISEKYTIVAASLLHLIKIIISEIGEPKYWMLIH